MATTIRATRQVVEDYQRLFVNRRAYTMQSMRPHPETGRHYYFRPSKRGNGRTPHADRGNHSPALGRQNHGGPVCHQPLDPAL